MPTTTDRKIILTGSPFAWIQTITGGALAAKWTLSNLQSSSYKALVSSTAATTGENIDINRADGAIIRFPKDSLILSGITESEETSVETSSDATGLGEITLVLNEAPVESNSMTAFLKELKSLKSSLFLITIGTGFSYKAKTDAALKKPEGFVHMIGKLSSDIEQSLGNSPSALTLTFVSYKNSGLDDADLTGATFTAITWKKGGTGDVSGITPPAIAAGEATSLLEGDIVVATAITYA